jgi:hypothetical protein
VCADRPGRDKEKEEEKEKKKDEGKEEERKKKHGPRAPAPRRVGRRGAGCGV